MTPRSSSSISFVDPGGLARVFLCSPLWDWWDWCREPMPMAGSLLQMTGIDKSFPGVQALRGVNLTLQAGEVLALLGENGAGKSTLMKILGGAMAPDGGSIELGGQPVQIDSPTQARRLGIAMIHQEFNLVPALSARENIFLGQ